MEATINLTVNGHPHGDTVEPRLLLVHYLRDHLRLTGTHIGCDTSQCGACAVLLNGEAVKSCTLFAVQAEGADLTTIEGIGTDGDLHPIQQGFHAEHGMQCGYCTPGMVIAAYDLLSHNPDPTETEIRHALHGNICRCTGYQHIVKAIENAVETLREQQRTPTIGGVQ